MGERGIRRLVRQQNTITLRSEGRSKGRWDFPTDNNITEGRMKCKTLLSSCQQLRHKRSTAATDQKVRRDTAALEIKLDNRNLKEGGLRHKKPLVSAQTPKQRYTDQKQAATRRLAMHERTGGAGEASATTRALRIADTSAGGVMAHLWRRAATF